VALDSKCVISYINKQAEELFGFEGGAVIGVGTPMLFHDVEEMYGRILEYSAETGVKMEASVEAFGILLCRGGGVLLNGRGGLWTWTQNIFRHFFFSISFGSFLYKELYFTYLLRSSFPI
jgi:PAS domain-containing protein